MLTVMVAFAVAQADFTAKRYYPLTPGDKWTYSDSESPGSVYESTVLPRFDPDASTLDPSLNRAAIETVTAYYPVEEREDGQITATPCFRENENTVFLVGHGLNRPITPRPILRVGRKAQDWDYYGDIISPIQPDPLHIDAHSQLGPKEQVLGQMRQTIVATLNMTLGDPKQGIALKQVWHYAEDIGMFRMEETGHVGKHKTNHVRTLTKFEPGPSSTVGGTQAH